MYIVDQVDEKWAVIEIDGEMCRFPRGLLPQHVEEGDLVRITIEVDPKATAERKNEMEKKMNDLFE